MGLLSVVVGVMGSSKSSRAIADVKNLRLAGHKVLVIKPKLDDRDGGYIKSRLINETINADLILEPNSKIDIKSIINSNYDCIVADEIHMLDPDVIEKLYQITALSNTDVHLYGLAISWKGKPFISTAVALAYADEIDKIKTVDKEKHLMTHHIKHVNGKPCDINTDAEEIETGDFTDMKYTTVSKQRFYSLYKILGQLDIDNKGDN